MDKLQNKGNKRYLWKDDRLSAAEKANRFGETWAPRDMSQPLQIEDRASSSPMPSAITDNSGDDLAPPCDVDVDSLATTNHLSPDTVEEASDSAASTFSPPPAMSQPSAAALEVLMSQLG